MTTARSLSKLSFLNPSVKDRIISALKSEPTGFSKEEANSFFDKLQNKEPDYLEKFYLLIKKLTTPIPYTNMGHEMDIQGEYLSEVAAVCPLRKIIIKNNPDDWNLGWGFGFDDSYDPDPRLMPIPIDAILNNQELVPSLLGKLPSSPSVESLNGKTFQKLIDEVKKAKKEGKKSKGDAKESVSSESHQTPTKR